MNITADDITRLRKNAATHAALGLQIAEDEREREIYRDDFESLELIAQWLDEGQVRFAADTAVVLDTLVRDLIPQPIWIAICAEVA